MSEQETQAELQQVAKQIRAWQEQGQKSDPKKFSDSQLLRDYPALGTSRTYTRCIAGDTADLDCERWLLDYRSVWALIQTLIEASSYDEPLYDDLLTVKRLRLAVVDAMRESGPNRLVLFQAPSGSGKTAAGRLLQGKFGQSRIVFCEAVETWHDSPAAMLRGLLKAIGTPAPSSASEMFVACVAALKEPRRCLIIDEGHHLGPKTLNVLKSLINQTPGEVVLLAMGTLWRRIETTNYEEARQLMQNRLSERIRMDGADEADVAIFFERRLGMNGTAREAARAIRDMAAAKGHLSFVKLVCREARRMAGKGEVDVATVAKAAARVAGTR